MPKDSFDLGIKPIKIKPLKLGFETPSSKKVKRTLGDRDKQILYKRANGRCECCERKIDYSAMQSGHKKASSKGGTATWRNSVCLCYECNKLQGTDSWATFMKKMGKSKTTSVTSSKTKKTTKKKTTKRKSSKPFGIEPIKMPKLKF